MSSSLVTDTLTELAATLTDLKDRVRVALAGELARLVADAVRDVVQTVLRREPGDAIPHTVPYSTTRPWRPPADPWADDQPGWESGESSGTDAPGADRTSGRVGVVP